MLRSKIQCITGDSTATLLAWSLYSTQKVCVHLTSLNWGSQFEFQGRLLAAAQTVLVVGTTHLLLRESTRNLNTKHQKATALLLIVHSWWVTIKFPGRYLFHSKSTKTFSETPLNGHMQFNSHNWYSPIVKLLSGECENCRGALADFGYYWKLRIWRRGQIWLNAVSTFTAFVHNWWKSTTSGVFMFLYGERAMVRVWEGFEDILFSDQWKHDWVIAFHPKRMLLEIEGSID